MTDNQNVNKQVFEVPTITRLGTVEELTLTNRTVFLSDVPMGTPLQPGSNF